jgi:hypothetical protein
MIGGISRTEQRVLLIDEQSIGVNEVYSKIGVIHQAQKILVETGSLKEKAVA